MHFISNETTSHLINSPAVGANGWWNGLWLLKDFLREIRRANRFKEVRVAHKQISFPLTMAPLGRTVAGTDVGSFFLTNLISPSEALSSSLRGVWFSYWAGPY
jgi:hypothetical protein